MNHKTTLHLLLVLTYITAGLNIISYAGTALLLPQMQHMVAQTPQLVPEVMRTYMDMYLSMPRLYFAGMTLLYALELAGGIMMWQVKAAGFHGYTLARLLLLLVPLLFLGKDFVQLGDVMFAALFILTYWLLMKQLGAFDRGSDSNGDIVDTTTPDDSPTLP